jgi:hypothetical protein
MELALLAADWLYLLESNVGVVVLVLFVVGILVFSGGCCLCLVFSWPVCMVVV